VSNLCVVNDSAERGVKLCHDFVNVSAKGIDYKIFTSGGKQ